ncbi:NigD-like protein [Bacteroides sp. 519]|uniref:NigD-like protein n=1 Tax=Bacteroides sp. 519 TaxID=2302937 RepID=UPI0013CF89E0|nr:NigD-like protein [Bacteroides sp. 519]NDV59337.1 hypothetical protein [Bacteroides sp. 519]
MKKLSLYLLAVLFAIVTPFTLQSCDDDDDIYFIVRMATVNVISGDTFSLETDNGEKLWIATPTNVYWYKPVTGQRVLVKYTILSDEYQGYDHMISLDYISDVLTKSVEELTEENEEEYANDAVHIEDMWIGGNYFNVQFRFCLPNHYKHRVSLVENTTAENPDDGYIHLEYRYNTYDDVTNVWARSLVSFNLGDYAPAEASTEYKGIKVTINSAVNGTKTYSFDFKENADNKRIEDSEEINPTEGKVG